MFIRQAFTHNNEFSDLHTLVAIASNHSYLINMRREESLSSLTGNSVGYNLFVFFVLVTLCLSAQSYS